MKIFVLGKTIHYCHWLSNLKLIKHIPLKYNLNKYFDFFSLFFFRSACASSSMNVNKYILSINKKISHCKYLLRALDQELRDENLLTDYESWVLNRMIKSSFSNDEINERNKKIKYKKLRVLKREEKIYVAFVFNFVLFFFKFYYAMNFKTHNQILLLFLETTNTNNCVI